MTLDRLERRGLIVDPIEWLGILVLGFVPYHFSRLTEEGNKKVLKLKAFYWDLKVMNTEAGRDFEFNLRIVDQFRRFLIGLAKIRSLGIQISNMSAIDKDSNGHYSYQNHE